MKDPNKILILLDTIWKRKSTNKGIILLLLFINPIYIGLILLVYSILGNYNIFIEIDNLIKFFLISLFILLILNLVIFLIWLYWRQVPLLDTTKNWIIFGPHSNEECKELVLKLFEQFKIEIKKNKIESFKYKLLPESIIINNEKDANELILKTGARLIIFGNVTRGEIDGEMVEGFKSISFTLRHRILDDYEKKPVIEDLAGAFAYREFKAKDKNSFFEKDMVIENLSEVACLFIAMGLTLEGKVDESIKILEILLNKVNNKIFSEKNNTQLLFFKNSITSCLTVSLRSKFEFIYKNYLIENILNKEYDKYAEQCKKTISKLRSINKKDHWLYLASAIIYFHFNNVNKAKQEIASAKVYFPQNFAAPHFSSAFLNLWSKDYKKSLDDYLKASRCSFIEINTVMQLILFLQGLLKNHPERIELIFAIAFVNDIHFDKVRALKDYKLFLRKTGKNDDIKVLRDYADIRIDHLMKKN